MKEQPTREKLELQRKHDLLCDLIANESVAADDFDNEKYDRMENAGKAVDFGINYLDDAINGLLPSDFVVIGGRTGVGKSQLASLIALHNIRQKKNVYYFALEACNFETLRRLKYSLIRQYNPNMPTYKEWLKGENESEMVQFEEQAKSKNLFDLNFLKTFYRKSTRFGLEELELLVDYNKETTDLFIVDHLHYFDHDTSDENIAIRDTLKKIRDLTLEYKVPIILIAHLRKKTKTDKELVPDLEEFHGSSEITKIPTQVITLAKYYGDTDRSSAAMFPTLFKIAKDRDTGSNTIYTGLVHFDIANLSYTKEYDVYRLIKGGTTLGELKDYEMPKYYKQHLKERPQITNVYGGSYD